MNVLSERGRERVEKICRLCDEGLSFTQIAAEIGTTRCAVAGVLKRQGRHSWRKSGQKKLPVREDIQVPARRWKPGGILLRAGWFG